MTIFGKNVTILDGKHFSCDVYWESMADSVIQATGRVEFEDGFRKEVLQDDSWYPYSGRAIFESDTLKEAGLDHCVV